MVISTLPDQQSINVSWMMLDCQNHHGIITIYEVRYANSDFGNSTVLTLNTTNGDETSLMVVGLEEFTNYTIEVRAYTAVGPGPYSAPLDVLTLPDRKLVVCLVFGCICTCVCSFIMCVHMHAAW